MLESYQQESVSEPEPKSRSLLKELITLYKRFLDRKRSQNTTISGVFEPAPKGNGYTDYNQGFYEQSPISANIRLQVIEGCNLLNDLFFNDRPTAEERAQMWKRLGQISQQLDSQYHVKDLLQKGEKTKDSEIANKNPIVAAAYLATQFQAFVGSVSFPDKATPPDPEGFLEKLKIGTLEGRVAPTLTATRNPDGSIVTTQRSNSDLFPGDVLHTNETIQDVVLAQMEKALPETDAHRAEWKETVHNMVTDDAYRVSKATGKLLGKLGVLN